MRLALKILVVFSAAAASFLLASYFIPARLEIFGKLGLANNSPQLVWQSRLVFVGDIMLDRGVEYMVEKYGAGDWTFPFALIADFLSKADLVFANLEGPVSDQGVRAGSIYSFRMRPAALAGLRFANIGVVSLANNHALDYTRAALEDTLARLETAGIVAVGAGPNGQIAHNAKFVTIGDTKLAFLAFSNLGPASWSATAKRSGIAWLSEPSQVRPFVAAARQAADLVVVSLHAGEEYQSQPTAFQRSFAEQAALVGADLVIQHHSHVVQPLAQLKLTDEQDLKHSAWVAYGLGNFVFDQGFSEATKQGSLLEVIIVDKKITEIVAHKVVMNEFFQPQLLGLMNNE